MQKLIGMVVAIFAILFNCRVIWHTLTANDPVNDFEDICENAFTALALNTLILAGYLLAPYF